MSSQENKTTSLSASSTKEKIMDDIVFGFGGDMGHLCMNELYADIVFLVEDQRLPAHRLILATRSEYFRGLLYGGMAESNQQEIPLNVSLDAFKVILKYIYSGTLPLSQLDMDAIIGVFNLAHFYGLQNVEAGIKQSLLLNLDLSNVCMILNGVLCEWRTLNQLIEECLNFMDRNGSDLLKHDSFQMLSKESLEEVLRRDTFIVPEVDIFHTVCKWSRHNPSVDIKEVISLVRLPLMTVDDLVHVVSPSGIFEPNQILEAIGKVTTRKNLPHRAVVLPVENEVTRKHIMLWFKETRGDDVFELSSV